MPAACTSSTSSGGASARAARSCSARGHDAGLRRHSLLQSRRHRRRRRRARAGARPAGADRRRRLGRRPGGPARCRRTGARSAAGNKRGKGPAGRAVALLDRARRATGMSFDVDILVRLVWEGLPVESVQTRVVYPPGGRSHFRLLRDNLRISATHTRLFFASFAPRSAAAHWSRLSERGALWGLRFLVAAYRLGGRPLFRAFLYPVMLYFFLFASVARRASRDFLRRAHRAGSPRLPSPPTWRDSFRHFLAFADATLDKVGAWLDRVPSRALELVDDRAWARLRANGRGSLLIGSHLGNLHVPHAFARGERAGAAVTALVFTQHAQNFNRLLRE